MAQGRSARDQLGVDLPDPVEPVAVETPPQEPERPEWLPENFKDEQEFASAYKSAQDKIREQGENQKRLEAQINNLSELIENQQQQEPPPPAGNDDQIRAQLQESLDRDPIGTIAFLAQQYAEQIVNSRFEQIQTQNDPALRAQADRDNQLLAMMVDQRLGETISDWDDYRDKVGQMIVEDQTLIPEQSLMNPEATVAAIRRVYDVAKARDVLEQSENGNFVTEQMKRQAQTMSGSGVRGPQPSATDEKMEQLRAAVQGASYSAWRGA